MDALMLDGNAIAGDLHELFAAEMTTAIGTCAACGASEPLGAVHVYRGAGVVLRCPHCSSVLARITRAEGRLWVDFRGTQTLEISL